MRSRLMLAMALAVIVVMMAACGSGAPAQQSAAQSSQAQAPQVAQIQPTEAPKWPEMKATDAPKAAQSTPTTAPKPTEAPKAAAKVNVDDAASIIAAWKAAGLEAEDAYQMQAKDYGLAPFVCKGTRFIIPSLGKTDSGDGKGGRLFVCANDKELEALKTYYTKLGEAGAFFASHLYASGPALVQINSELDKAVADQYGNVLLSKPVQAVSLKPKPTAAPPKTCKLDEACIVNGISVKVNSVDLDAKPSSDYRKVPVGKKIVRADVTVENVGQNSHHVSTINILLRDGDGRMYEEDRSTIRSTDIAKGEKARGEVDFVVDQNGKDYLLTYETVFGANANQIIRIKLDK